MIESTQYISLVKEYFNFLVTEFGFNISEEKVRGNAFYDVQYRNNAHIVSVSYENIEDYLQVIIFLLQNGVLPDYDDKSKTLHLSQLNARVLSIIDKNDVHLNNEYFSKFEAEDGLSRKLLKLARELRLCLKHFADLEIS